MNAKISRIVAIEYSKHRNAFGMVGIEVMKKDKVFRVRLAREWSRKNLNSMPSDIGVLFKQIGGWDYTYVNQKVGQHVIQELRKIEKIPLQVFTTKKDLGDPDDLERAKVMDVTEMTQYMVVLRQKHQVKFPENPPATVQELERQMTMFVEHKTESGTMAYYAPGDERDNLPRALAAACFAGRKLLRGGNRTISLSKKLPSLHSKRDELGSCLSGSQSSRGRETYYPGGTSRVQKYRIS